MFKLFKKKKLPETEEEVKDIIAKGEEEGIITEAEAEMIKGVFDVGDTEIEEVLIPRVDMISIQASAKIGDAIKLVIDEGYSRIPVYEGSLDNIIGIIHAKDLFRFTSLPDMAVIEALRLPTFVPVSRSVMNALKSLQKSKVSMAIVSDEYGGVCGLVTIEDLVEEIVGELQDEFDREETLYKKINEGSYLFNARIELDKFNELMKTGYKDEEVNTLAGLIFSRLERIPEKGETFEIDNLSMKITGADKQRIYKVMVQKVES